MNDDQLSVTNILGLVMCLSGICGHVIHKYSTQKPGAKKAPILDDDPTTASFGTTFDHHNRHPTAANHTGLMGKQQQQQIKLNYFASGQNLPLLDSTDDANQSDTDDDDSQCDNQNASEVIFDVLKRRDITRR